jgi:exoribonuclease-2
VEPRATAELRQLRQQRRRRQLNQEARRRWRDTLRRRIPIDADELEPEPRRQLEHLRHWAAGDRSEDLPEDLHRALQAAHCPAEPGAIRHLLVDLGQWPRHHLPSLAESRWSDGFPEEVRREAQRLLDRADDPMPGDDRRRDRTDLRSVTIDDEDTEDIDDGLALERRPDGGDRLWIHVADPGRLVQPQSLLDQEARRRGSSLYLARGSLPMFPSELVRGPFSLTAGRRCPAWSIWVDLGEDGSVLQAGIENTWVRPIYRLSYADADDLIALAPPQEEDLSRIQRLTALRHDWRLRRGAVAMEQPEGRIRVVEGQAELEIIEPSPARRMVAEAMVLAGTVVAEHGRRHGLALPFRSQLQPDLPPAAQLASLPAGPVRHAALRRCLGRGRMGTSPAPHFSLALEAYVQATSPIRRYGDLLAQRQLRALWSGAAPADAARLGALLEEVEAPVRQAIHIAREDQRHWLQVWFEQQERRQWHGLFLHWLRQKDRLGLVHVEELAMDLPATCPGDAGPADDLLVRLMAVDSLRDLLTLQAVA